MAEKLMHAQLAGSGIRGPCRRKKRQRAVFIDQRRQARVRGAVALALLLRKREAGDMKGNKTGSAMEMAENLKDRSFCFRGVI